MYRKTYTLSMFLGALKQGHCTRTRELRNVEQTSSAARLRASYLRPVRRRMLRQAKRTICVRALRIYVLDLRARGGMSCWGPVDQPPPHQRLVVRHREDFDATGDRHRHPRRGSDTTNTVAHPGTPCAPPKRPPIHPAALWWAIHGPLLWRAAHGGWLCRALSAWRRLPQRCIPPPRRRCPAVAWPRCRPHRVPRHLPLVHSSPRQRFPAACLASLSCESFLSCLDLIQGLRVQF